MAHNDHTDRRWDDGVLEVLRSVGRQVEPLEGELAAALARFTSYSARYTAALEKASRGESRWFDAVGIDSRHTVWMQLREDLLATLGLDRDNEAKRRWRARLAAEGGTSEVRYADASCTSAPPRAFRCRSG